MCVNHCATISSFYKKTFVFFVFIVDDNLICSIFLSYSIVIVKKKCLTLVAKSFLYDILNTCVKLA